MHDEPAGSPHENPYLKVILSFVIPALSFVISATCRPKPLSRRSIAKTDGVGGNPEKVTIRTSC